MNDLQDISSHAQSKCSAVLYLVATPIGHLKDITLRALEVLAEVDVIACEDTRISGKLLTHYDIATPLVSYHEHNGAQMRPKLLARLAAGESVALISDAGTPLISDPGYKLVREAQAANFDVVPVPGPCAAISALCASGLPTDLFTFIGFLPSKQTARWALLKSVKSFAGTLVVYESAKKLPATLRDIAEALGPREVVMARELTKRYEEILRLPIVELIAELKDRTSLKGEIVLLIGAPAKTAPSAQQLDEWLHIALSEGGTKAAAAQVAEQTGISKSVLYQRALELKNHGD